MIPRQRVHSPQSSAVCYFKMARSKRHGGQQKRSKKSVNKAKSSKKRHFKELKEKHSVDEE